MLSLLFLALAPAQFPVVSSAEFPREVQEAALAATVRIQNLTTRMNGTGAIVGVEGPFVYVLTAGHVIRGGDEFQVEIFSPKTYPGAKDGFRNVKVEAESQGVKDLALLRVAVGEKVARPIRLAPLAEVKNKKRSFDALTVGCGKGEAPTCEVVTVEAAKEVRRDTKGEKALCWEIGRPQVAGRSGGPMLDAQGRLIGVCSGNNKDRSYFCHLKEVEDFLTAKRVRYLIDD